MCLVSFVVYSRPVAVCGETFVSFCRADMDTGASASAPLSSGREGVWGHTVR